MIIKLQLKSQKEIYPNLLMNYLILYAFFLPPQHEGPHKKAMIQFLESKMKIVISLVTFSTVLLIL